MSLGIRASQPRLMALLAIAFAVALAALAGLTAGQARAADPAIFEAGAASVNINPDTPQYIGGYGYKAGPTKEVHDPLEMRAFVVGKGDKAAVFVVADLTGWFAAYKGDNLAPFGIDRTREKIADKLKEQGYDITRENVIISSTHVHAAPAVVGIWGTPDAAYLQKVSDAAVTAAGEAAAKAKPSEIWTATGNVRSFVWQNGQGTNHPDGFGVDEKLPIMWARDPQTGATNGLYANVPNHPDQFNGEDANAFSADWTGYARKKLDELNGGTAVIGAGTLGRQEPPGSDPTYNEVIPQGEYVANEIQRTMAKATPLTSDTIAGTESYMQMVADNDELILAMNFYSPPAGSCIDDYDICTIPRSTSPPYLSPGPGEDPLLGTFTSSIRIGDVIYSTNPGEAFPEVNDAIRDSIQGARSANVVALAGDFLGYYYVRDDYTEQQFGSSNFETYNVGPEFPQLNADKSRENASALGFQTTPQTVHAEYDADVVDRPGIQFYPDELESADPTFNLYAGAQKSQDESVPAPASIHWDFGDGSPDEDRPNGSRFDHTFPGPGTYEVTASVVGSNSKTREWTETVTVNPALTATAGVESRVYDSSKLKVSSAGGSGKLVGARWTCPDGSRVDGLTVDCPGNDAGTATVVAADGAGNTATASVPVQAGPPKPVAKLKLVKVTPKAKKIKRGRSVVVKATFRNVGTADATGAKACVVISKKSRKGVKAKPGCRKLGAIAAGKTKTAGFRLKTTRKARAKTVIQVKASASDAATATGRMTLRTKPARTGPKRR